MKLYQALLKRDAISLDEWASWFSFNGIGYPTLNQTLVGNEERIDGDFVGLVQGAYKSNGVIFACMLARHLLFSEARFAFREIRNGRPGNLHGGGGDGRNPGFRELQVLAKPWTNGTTGDLLTRMEQDGSLAGNFFVTRRGDRLQRLRPDWVTIVLGVRGDPKAGPWDLDSEVLGYMYKPGGPASGKDAEPLMADTVAHFAPIPDPVSPWRGMSWLSPVVREIMADGAATTHKLKFFEHGATPNMVATLDAGVTPEDFEKFVSLFKKDHEGVLNAYKTLFLGGGADVTVVGANLRQMEFKTTQGAGETRIAAAAGVPPVIVGLSEGLEASTYSNYGQARRRFADGTMRPLWRNACASLASIIRVPAGSELWYDDRDIAFLQEDQKDEAQVRLLNAQAIRTLGDGGYEPQSVIDAVTSDDLTRLKHTGLVPVQLQPPGTVMQPGNNGKVPADALAPGE